MGYPMTAHGKQLADSRQLWPDNARDPWMADAFEPALVSVIIPTYNRSSFILQALNSVKQQAYRPVEIIIVDDGSTDDTDTEVAIWSRHNCDNDGLRLNYVKQRKSGAPAARNLGLVKSNGEYIQFLDSDDILHPYKFEKQVERLLSDVSIDLVYSGSGLFTQTPDWSVAAYCGAAVPREHMLSEFLICNTCLWNVESGLYRRRLCITNGPWDQSLARFQDWEYNTRLLLLGTKVVHLRGLFSLARVSSNGRICDSPMRANKVREFISGVLAVERRILAAGLRNRHVRSGIATRYLRYTQMALMAGLLDVAREGVKAGLAHSAPWDAFGFMMCKAILLLPKHQIPSTTTLLFGVIARFEWISLTFRARRAGNRGRRQDL